ncbi:MAG: hydroxyisourate hydrolase [Rhodospirillaceae bacterium]
MITTHVLDTARGMPAAGVKIEIYRVKFDGTLELLKSSETNNDGRSAEPLVSGDQLQAGVYQITFFIGRYFESTKSNENTSVFLDQVPVRFTVSNPSSHYHVPLLASPYGYTTYRGS